MAATIDAMKQAVDVLERCYPECDARIEKGLVARKSLHAAITAEEAQTVEPVACRNCGGFGWEPSVYDGRRQCSHCKPTPPSGERAEFEAWWGEHPIELTPLVTQSKTDRQSAWVWLAWKARADVLAADAPLTRQGVADDIQTLIINGELSASFESVADSVARGVLADAREPAQHGALVVQQVAVPQEPTHEMVTAYLPANDAYWKRTDELPNTNPSRWRQGSVREATRESLCAALAAEPQKPQADAQRDTSVLQAAPWPPVAEPAQQVAVPQGWNYLLQLSRQNYLRQFGASTTADWVYDDLIDLFDEGAPHPPQAERVPMAKIEKQSAWIAATIELPSQERCYLRGIADAEAHHHIRAKL